MLQSFNIFLNKYSLICLQYLQLNLYVLQQSVYRNLYFIFPKQFIEISLTPTYNNFSSSLDKQDNQILIQL